MQNELKQEIIKSENLLENQLNVSSMKPIRNGNQTATVVLKQDIVKKVTREGFTAGTESVNNDAADATCWDIERRNTETRTDPNCVLNAPNQDR